VKEDLQVALTELTEALESLQGAVESRLERQRSIEDVEDEVVRMRADRAKLAESLDASQDRANRLVDANSEVSNRLVAAMEAIRVVLDRHPN
jgi:predicted nuclease with TOPRIM domain